jgi:acyl carrier protein
MFDDVRPADWVADQQYSRGAVSVPYVPPRDRIERVIARVVERAMALDTVGVHDDFFELGGDSVVGAGILSRISQLFDVELTFEDAIDAFTIERLAELVRERKKAAA